MHLIKTFSKELSKYLTKSDKDCSKLIKFETGKAYDFSFPISLNIWENYAIKVGDSSEKFQDNILRFAAGKPEGDSEETLEDLKMQNFTFQIVSIEIKNYRCNLNIRRDAAFKSFLTGLTDNYGKRRKLEDETLSLEIDSGDSATSILQYRLELIGRILTNLLKFSKFVFVSDPSIAKHKILVTTKSNLSKNDDRSDRKLLTCGTVLDHRQKKLSIENSIDYIKKRSTDMHLISIHKYGGRFKNDAAFMDLIERLGENAVTLELLEVKQSSPMTLNPDPKHAFILYNSARLETLLMKFDTKVSEGYYQETPELIDIDTSLLKEEEEWNLLKLLLTFPDVIDHAIDDLSSGKVSLHLIHKFISALGYSFSIYYRRARLLTENRSQLMPTMHAKIHLLRAVRRIFNEALDIFCIQPVAFM